MANDTDIFGDVGTPNNKPSDSDIFKDIVNDKPVAAAPKETASTQRDLSPMQRRMGLGHQGNTGILDTLHAVNRTIDEFGGAVTDLASQHGLPPSMSAPLGVAGNLALQVATMLPGRGGKALTSADEAANALARQRADVLAKGRDLGFVFPPTQVNPSMTNRLVESIGGKAPTAQEAAAKNEASAYAIAQREAGLKPTQSINPENLAAARNELAAPYRDIEKLESLGVFSQPPFKSPGETLKDIQNIRRDVKDKWFQYQRVGTPSIRDEAKALSAKADQLESQLELQVSAAGKPDLAQAYREARQAIAKNLTVERAMRGSSFEPAALSRLESRGKTPLGGDLETIMQLYRDFPKAMAAPQVGGSVGVHQLMPWVGGGGGGTIGAILGGAPGAGIGSMAGMVAGQSIPPAARTLLLSKAYQEALGKIPMIAPSGPALAPRLVGPALLRMGSLSQE